MSSTTTAGTPFTEQVNPLTVGLDTASAVGMIGLLGHSDAQLYPMLLDDEAILDRLQQFSQKVGEALSNDGLVVISGCGTSGRLALATAITYNNVTSSQRFVGLLAGSNSAMLVPQELGEDDPSAGVRDLQRVLTAHHIDGESSVRRAVFVGVTCGLSAAYVAGQLDFAFDHPELFSAVVLIGFNPVELARDLPIERWSKTFRQVARRFAEPVENADNSPRLLINPIVGPEAVQGSSRMKGGTMTKILLDVAIGHAIAVSKPDEAETETETETETQSVSLRSLLQRYEAAQSAMYGDAAFCQNLASIVEMAGSALRIDPQEPTKAKAHLYYVGTSASSGWLAMTDASECLSTFGAALTDVRCFLPDGWRIFGDEEFAVEMIGYSKTSPFPVYNVTYDELPWDTLSTDDAIVLVVDSNSQRELVASIVERCSQAQQRVHCQYAVVGITSAGATLDCQALPPVSAIYALPADLAQTGSVLLKLCLNAITTGGHVLKGKVFQNRMIDLAVSNAKLFYRTIGIVSELGRVSRDRALTCLLQSIYQADSEVEFAQQEYDDIPVSQHITAAMQRALVVPVALLLALDLAKTAHGARQLLLAQPIVNKHIPA